MAIVVSLDLSNISGTSWFVSKILIMLLHLDGSSVVHLCLNLTQTTICIEI